METNTNTLLSHMLKHQDINDVNTDSPYSDINISGTSMKTVCYKGVDGKKCCQAAYGNNSNIIVRKSKHFPSRYDKKEVLGTGTFGEVIRAYDKIANCDVAIKVIQLDHYQSKALVEIEHLKLLNEIDVHGDQHIVRLKDYFVCSKKIHMVFECLGLDLYKSMKRVLFKGLSLQETRNYARQICGALKFLSRPEIRLMHGDLKPANILLSGLNDNKIKIADFGLSCRLDSCNQPVQSLYYRAPEVILGIPYTIAIDMWSFACVVVELHTNEALFNGSTPDIVIGKMVEVLGMPPKELLDRAPRAFKYFDIHPTTGIYSLKDKGIIPGSKPLGYILGVEYGGPDGKWRGRMGHAPATYKVFLKFLLGILNYMPEERFTPEQALNHDFFKPGGGVPPQPIPHLTKPRPLRGDPNAMKGLQNPTKLEVEPGTF